MRRQTSALPPHPHLSSPSPRAALRVPHPSRLSSADLAHVRRHRVQAPERTLILRSMLCGLFSKKVKSPEQLAAAQARAADKHDRIIASLLAAGLLLPHEVQVRLRAALPRIR